MVCNVTGTLWLPDGTAYASGRFTLSRTPLSVVGQQLHPIIPDTLTVTANVSGYVAFQVMPGDYIGRVQTSRGEVAFGVRIPEATSADMANCVDAYAEAPSNITPTGIFYPVLTTVQRDSITAPTNGQAIYNSTTASLEVYSGGAWSGIAGIGASAVVRSDLRRARNFYADDAAFTAAATLAGESYPTPYLTRTDLPPQSINIHDIGMVPSNLAADASNNVAAFQAIIDWLTSKTNGGTIEGTAFDPKYSNPIYGLNASITLKPKVSFNFSPSIRFRATAAMDAMLVSLTGASNRLSQLQFKGGFWDCGGNANYGFRIKDFQNIQVGDQMMTVYNPVLGGVLLGDAAQSANSYGAYLDRLWILRPNSLFAGSPFGIASTNGISDSRFDNIDIIGFAYGMQGKFYISKFEKIHPWSAPTTQGHHLRGFDLSGGRNVLMNCQVDEAWDTPYYIDESNTKMIGCAATQVDPGNHNLRYMVTLTANATNFVADLCTANDRVDAAFLGFATGVQADTNLGHGNTCWFGPRPPIMLDGYTRTFANITVNPGSAPTINASRNIASITRNGDGDYTFVFSQAMPSLAYNARLSASPVTQPQTIILRERTKATNSYRVQVMDNADAFLVPATITVEFGR